MQFEKRYIFRGHAVATEAHIRTPQEHICWIQGAMALPVTGGYGKIEVPGRVCDIPDRQSSISFDSASAFVSGDFIDPDGGYAGDRAGYRDLPSRTVTAAYVNGLNVLDKLRVEALSAHLVLDDPRNGEQPTITRGAVNPITQRPEPEPIVGLSIGGFPVTIEFDPVFRELSTLQALQERYEDDEDFREEYRDRFMHDGDDHSIFHPHRLPSYGGVVVTSIVKSIRFADGVQPGSTIQGNMIQVENFARIHVGELIITESSRRLTLLRLQMGQEQDNDAYGDVESNPSGIPPTHH